MFRPNFEENRPYVPETRQKTKNVCKKQKMFDDPFPRPYEYKKCHTRFQTVNRNKKARDGWKRLGVGCSPGFGATFSTICRTVAGSTPMTNENRWGFCLESPTGSEIKAHKKVAMGAYGSFKDFLPKWGEYGMLSPGFHCFCFLFHQLTSCVSGPCPKGQVSEVFRFERIRIR